MTVQEIQKSDKVFLLATDIAPVLQCDPHWIRLTARHNPERLADALSVSLDELLGRKAI